MSKKVKVFVEVEEGQEVVIKPLGETQAEKIATPEGAPDATTSGTTSNGPNGGDVDVDVDF